MLDIKDYENPTTNYTIIDNRIFKYFKNEELNIICILLRYKNLKTINISNNFLSNQLNKDIKTIAKIINKFIQDGIISKEEIKQDGKKTNQYCITLHYSKITTIINQGEEENPTDEETPQQPIKTQPDPQETQNNHIDEVLVYYKNKTDTKLCKDKTIVKNLKIILKEYSIEDVKLVIDYILKDEWYLKENQATLSVITRPTNKKQPTTNKKPLNFI